jgi:flagellar hook-associated protein 3 FlgL
MEQLTSMKKVNRASDDPTAATKILDIRQNIKSMEQYEKNAQNCESWVNATEAKLSSAYDLLVRVGEIAIGQSTATANASTRQTAANEIQAIIDEMISIANSRLGDRYLFSGSRNDVAPFSATSTAAKIEPAGAASENTFAGTVSSSGAYTGAVNKTYVLKITSDGPQPMAAATYQYSTDGGKTWNGSDLSLAAGLADLGDGVVLNFDDAGGTQMFGTNDAFYVNAIADGYYSGNSEELSVAIDRGIDIRYNISGAQAFTAAGSCGVDVFSTLNALKDALVGNDAKGISGQLEQIKNAQNQVTLNQSLCGAKANHIEMARDYTSSYKVKLESSLSDSQDADLTELATKLSMKEVALQASYAVASKIGNMTILDYLS